MGRVFAGRSHSIVTVATVSGDAGMIEIGGNPADRGMTIVTGIAAIDMCRILAGRDRAVVTAVAGTNNLRVIDSHCRRKGNHIVAVLAYQGGLYVCWVLADGVGAVVTAGTIAGDVHVVEIGRNPSASGMTIIASVATGQVRGMFAGCGHTVMTRTATADYLCVINSVSWHPDSRVVAVFADIAGQNVSGIFPGCIGPVMAARAIAGDVDVIEVRRHPAIGGMTVVAAVATRNVGRVLTRCDIAVVTRLTGTDDLSVVHHGGRRPKIHAMAVFADRSRCYVTWVFAGCIAAVMAA